MWWVVTGIGVLTAVALWIYDRTIRPHSEEATGRESKAAV
jgi:hypothetical protein